MYQKRWADWRWAPQLVVGVVVCVMGASEIHAQTKTNLPGIEKSQSKTTKQEMSQHTDDLRALMQTLYEAHPEELAKSTQVGPREMTEWVFDGKANWRFEAVRRKQQMEAIALVFDPEYTGDQLLAFVVGLETLLFDAYGGKNEYDIPAMRHDIRLSQLKCQLESVQKKLDGSDKPVVFLDQPASRQLIQKTMQTIIQRIHIKDLQQVAAEPRC